MESGLVKSKVGLIEFIWNPRQKKLSFIVDSDVVKIMDDKAFSDLIGKLERISDCLRYKQMNDENLVLVRDMLYDINSYMTTNYTYWNWRS